MGGMACARCLDEPYEDKLCERCFARRVHKRITRAMRSTLSDSDKTVGVVNAGCAGAVLEHVVRDVLKNSNRTIVVSNDLSEDKVFLPDTVDVVLYKHLESIAGSGTPFKYPDNVITPLARVSKNHCALLAKHWGIACQVEPVKSFPGLDEIESKYPGTLATLSKALL